MEALKHRLAVSELIDREHFGRGRSIRALERQFGLSNGTLSRWCQVHGIAVRTRLDQVRITSQEPNPNRPTGERHWAWGLKRADVAERMRQDNPMKRDGVREAAVAGMAERLRENMTGPERDLFAVLAPLGFVAQLAVGAFVVDLALAEHKVAIEVDGKNHWSRERAARDLARDAWLVGQGWRVFRVANSAAGDPARLLAILKDHIPGLEIPCLQPRRRTGPEYRVLLRDAENPAGRKVHPQQMPT